MELTLFEKLWAQHVIAGLGDGIDLLYIDRILLHERTGSIALKSLAESGLAVRHPEQVFATIDHIVDTFRGRSDTTMVPHGGDMIRATRDQARQAGIRLFDIDDAGQGIVHVIAPEHGITQPGLTIVCPDSHTCTQGAFGALAWGIGSSEAEHALATKTLAVAKPKTMLVRIAGALAAGVTAKDLVLHLLATHGTQGGNGYAVEFAGEAINAMDMEARMTLCNMAVEFSAFTGIIAPDAKAIDYIHDRTYAPRGVLWQQAKNHWSTLMSDANARFDATILLDAAAVEPMVTWGTSPQHAIGLHAKVPDPAQEPDGGRRNAMHQALAYMGVAAGMPLAGLAIDAAFIGSCTNARLSDLRRAAAILKGRRVAAGVKAICVPGSTAVKRAAEAEGIDRIFEEAGFEWRESGCSLCFYAGGEGFDSGDRVISSTNRNFEGRQGPGTRTHLASPETVAASAVAGHIANAGKLIG